MNQKRVRADNNTNRLKSAVIIAPPAGQLRAKANSDKETCSKTLRYDGRASISLDEEFKHYIALIRENAEQKYLAVLINIR